MNLKLRLQEIAEFLQPYQNIWQNEIMLMYPRPLDGYNLTWLDEIASFTNKEDVIKLEKKEVHGLIQNHELLSFYRRIEELTALPQAPELPPMPENSYTWLYMIPKKQYEIRKLAPFVHHSYHQNNIEEIIDIGGGIGLLAQTLCNQYNLRVASVDMDPVMQETGKKRHEKNAKHLDNKVQYHNVKVNADELAFIKLLHPKKMTLGLHTCGELALDQVRASAKASVKQLINFGCCYHKLSKAAKGQNLSEFSKTLPFQVNQSLYALTLACRAHKKMDDKDYKFKVMVKAYRYAIHFLLHDEYDMKEIVTLGNSHPKLYQGSFSNYALEQFKRLNIAPKQTPEELDAYYAQAERSQLIWRMLAAGLLRNAFGRALELYLLLDRAIYLQEQGYEVQVLEFFEEEVSPRNIGIVATLV